jgi:uncharacterized membrane protein YfcA
VFLAVVAGGGIGALLGIPAARVLADRASVARRVFAIMVLIAAAYVGYRATH